MILEKNFTNAILLSASVFVALMVIVPPVHTLAQNDAQIDEKVRVHKATIEDVGEIQGSLSVDIGGGSVRVITNASTTVFSGTGDEISFVNLSEGANIYVFGKYDKETNTITADKLVVRNKRITERTTLSRAEMARNKIRGEDRDVKTPPFEVLGLTEKEN